VSLYKYLLSLVVVTKLDNFVVC